MAPFALRHLLGASLDAAKQAALREIPPIAELQKLAAGMGARVQHTNRQGELPG